MTDPDAPSLPRCMPDNPHAGFGCKLPYASGLRWFICPTCGTSWFTKPSRWALRSGWSWTKLETHLREAAKAGIRERLTRENKEI
jgi:hypothetical protein